MFDSFGRDINYLRISVIDRCNLRCFYCMPHAGLPLKAHHDILSLEEIAEIVKIAASEYGIKKVRLTGGEPLIRRNISHLVTMLAAIDGVEDLSMTTNGTLLAAHAHDLARAGLMRVNVSLDTLDAARFADITSGKNGDCDNPGLSSVLHGIDVALQAGLQPIKINCVIARSSDEPDAVAVKKYAEEKGLSVRFIHRMDFARGIFSKVEGGVAGECRSCNRLRLLSDGRVLPCLFSDQTFSIRELGIRAALTHAILHKPERGLPCARTKWMVEVGG